MALLARVGRTSDERVELNPVRPIPQGSAADRGSDLEAAAGTTSWVDGDKASGQQTTVNRKYPRACGHQGKEPQGDHQGAVAQG